MVSGRGVPLVTFTLAGVVRCFVALGEYYELVFPFPSFVLGNRINLSYVLGLNFFFHLVFFQLQI